MVFGSQTADGSFVTVFKGLQTLKNAYLLPWYSIPEAAPSSLASVMSFAASHTSGLKLRNMILALSGV
jgi:hypothetical protein